MVAIVDWADVKTRARPGDPARGLRGARACRCLLADPARRGRPATAGSSAEGRRWTSSTGARVLSELVEREDEVRAVPAAPIATGLAVFVNSFRCQLSEDKAFFALLTDEAFAALLDAGRARAGGARSCPGRAAGGAAHAAATGVEVDLVPFVLEQRAELVLKPAHGYGGRSVLRGRRDGAGGVGGGRAGAVWAGPGSCRSAWPSRRRSSRWSRAARSRFEPLKVNANPSTSREREVGAVTRASRERRHQRQRRRRQRADLRRRLTRFDLDCTIAADPPRGFSEP